jgi:hypothetical protein
MRDHSHQLKTKKTQAGTSMRVCARRVLDQLYKEALPDDCAATESLLSGAAILGLQSVPLLPFPAPSVATVPFSPFPYAPI